MSQSPRAFGSQGSAQTAGPGELCVWEGAMGGLSGLLQGPGRAGVEAEGVTVASPSSEWR